MDKRLTDEPEEPLAETPEDVAVLYSWANLHGAKYRDFSASRREYRAQVRHRAAEDLRTSELNAAAQAEAAAAHAERIAREAERAAHSPERFENPYDRERALREADEAARRASAERVEAARRAEAAALAEAQARKEEREIAEAHVSAERQAARWHDSEIRRSRLAGPQPTRSFGLSGDPYETTQGSSVNANLPTPDRSLEYTQPARYREDEAERSRLLKAEEASLFRQTEPDYRRPRGYRPDQVSGIRPVAGSVSGETPVRNRINGGSDPSRRVPGYGQDSGSRAAAAAEEQRAEDANAPAWLFGSSAGTTPSGQRSAAGASPVSDTLQHSRERVASRWFALKGVFEEGQEPPAQQVETPREARTPVLSVFSLAGGVGKTSMVATLGRALSSLGEKVLLADTTSQGLLPYYFGATELKPGVVRTFSPPSGSTDAPIHLVSYDVNLSHEPGTQEAVANEVINSGSGVQRVVLDLNIASGWLIRKLPSMAQTVLVPMAPDMNSVITLQAVERYFNGAVDGDGRPLLPYYVLTQFDAALPLHLDVREVLKRQLGDRLLPYSIRRSPAVSEALAEGMTVVDYAPEGAISEDYLNVANWLRSISVPATHGFRTARWSER